MPLLKKRRVLAFKLEATKGTAESLGADDCIYVVDPEIQAEIPMADRFATGSRSRLASVPGTRSGRVSFGVEVAASGASNASTPAWAELFLACGMSQTGDAFTFTSDSSDYETVTIGLYEDGVVKTLAGAMGTWTIDAEVGRPAMVRFEFTGCWVAPADSAMLALPSHSVVPPRFASATLSLGSESPRISRLSLAANNNVHLIEDVTKATGYAFALVTDRNVTGQMDPEATTVASWDVFGDWIAGTTGALSCQIGTDPGNRVTLAGPRCQNINLQESDRGLMVTHDLDFQLNATSAGDNELTITFS